MAERVYVVRDPRAIEFIENDDLDGFKAYLDAHPTSDIGKEEHFWTKEEAIAFCSGLEYGVDEHTGIPPYPLRSWEVPATWFMRLIKRPGDLEEIKAYRKTLKDEETLDKLFVVYGLTNHELGAALVEEDYEYFRDMVKNGDAGKILKCICTSRERAEDRIDYLVRNHDAIILCDYDEGNEPYAKVIEEGKCYCLMDDEREEED